MMNSPEKPSEQERAIDAALSQEAQTPTESPDSPLKNYVREIQEEFIEQEEEGKVE